MARKKNAPETTESTISEIVATPEPVIETPDLLLPEWVGKVLARWDQSIDEEIQKRPGDTSQLEQSRLMFRSMLVKHVQEQMKARDDIYTPFGFKDYQPGHAIRIQMQRLGINSRIERE